MKKVTAALALGLLIGSATTAIAATDVLQATVSIFKFVVNGEQQQLKNAPIVVNGSSYLPVREVAELLGADVGFDNGTIKLETKDVSDVEAVTAEWVPLRDLAKEYGVEVGIPNPSDHKIVINYQDRSMIFIVTGDEEKDAVISNEHGHRLKIIDGGLNLHKDDVEYLIGQ